MAYSATVPTLCSERPTGLAVSNYISSTPVCNFSTDGSGNLIMTVSNLRITGDAIDSYGLIFDGLTTAGSARRNYHNSDTNAGLYVVTYESSTARDTILLRNDFTWVAASKTSGVTMVFDPARNGDTATLTIAFAVVQPVVVSGSLVLALPYQNSQYSALGGVVQTPMVTISTLTATSYYTPSGGTQTSTSPTITLDQQTSLTYVRVLLNNGSVITSGSVLTVVLGNIKMPPSYKPLEGVEIYTADSDYLQTEYMTGITITNSLPGTQDQVTLGTSVAEITTQTGVLETDQTYQFTVYFFGDLPMSSYYTLTVPTEVGMPSSGVSGLTLSCIQFCTTSDITMSYNSGTRVLTFNNAVPTESDYKIGQSGALIFTLQGFTNPATSDAAYFIWNSYAMLDGVPYQIDQISSMYIQAQQGVCTIDSLAPTDGNYKIYGVPNSWTTTMYCEHEFDTSFGMRITWPSDFYVISTSSCIMEGLSTSYTCIAANSGGTITLTTVFASTVSKKQSFTFTINSVRNPTLLEQSYDVLFEIISSANGVVDLGTYNIKDTLMTKGEIWAYTVLPASYGVGQFPVDYKFSFQPSGEMHLGSYIVITIPDEISIYRERDLERFCSYDLVGFTRDRINCKVNGNKITISTGFRYAATTNMVVQDLMVPPTISFRIPQFWNSRTMQPTSPFQLSIYNEDDKETYTWSTTKVLTVNAVASTSITAGPVVQMNNAAEPQRVVFERGSSMNGVVTDYNFTVTPTNFLVEGDVIILELPSPTFFSEDTVCIGLTSNLRLNQTSTVSVGLDEIQISLLLPIAFRRLQVGSTRTIRAGEAFTFQLTGIKNPPSATPTAQSITYSSYTDGQLIEQLLVGLEITNSEAGVIEDTTASIVPADFKQSLNTNYTLTFKPRNYQQHLHIKVWLPKQIRFSQNSVECYGAQGTDSPTVNCVMDQQARMIEIDDAVQYQAGNPGTIGIVFSTFKNPERNIVTDSFLLRTFTHQGYALDELTTGLTINFFCEYPCASCDPLVKNFCTSCYGGDQFQILHENQCLEVCPFGFTDPGLLKCEPCEWPCETCSDTTSTCVTCLEGYQLNDDRCVEKVQWPFPYLIWGAFNFLIILISEICTKTESRFKEAFIATMSIPELFSWITFLAFYQARKGAGGSFAIGLCGILIYAVLNLIHAIVHPRQMIPQSMSSYKAVNKNYRFSSFLIKTTSYCCSFKYSLLMVSYFCVRPRFKGDYSPANWKQFNRFSLAFILLPYPLMMFACILHLYTDGLFSYASFAAIEVICISTLLASIMLLDAVTAVKNKARSTATEIRNKIATGADYESDDEMKLGKLRKRGNAKKVNLGEEFGQEEEEEEISQASIRSSKQLLSSSDKNREDDATRIQREVQAVIDQYAQRSGLDETTMKQIAMLEELARQMRDEKEQLRLEKERIERERQAMIQDQLNQSALMKVQNFVNGQTDYEESQKATHDEELQVQDYQDSQLDRFGEMTLQEQEMERQREQEELRKAQERQRRKRAGYRDIEGEEMEDYDQVDDNYQSSDSEFNEMPGMPLPVYGQIMYSRSKDGEQESYMKQLTARAGGDSIIGPPSLQDEGIYMLTGRQTPEYDLGTNLPSIIGPREDFVNRSNASFSQNTLIKVQDESVIYQQRSDAQLERDSVRSHAADEEDFIIMEPAVFEDASQRPSIQGSEYNVAGNQAFIDFASQRSSRHASPREFFAAETAIMGETRGAFKSHYEIEDEDFFEMQSAAFGDYTQEAALQREGTPQQYFEGINQSMGAASEFERHLVASEKDFTKQEPPTTKRFQSQMSNHRNDGQDIKPEDILSPDDDSDQSPKVKKGKTHFYDKDGNVVSQKENDDYDPQINNKIKRGGEVQRSVRLSQNFMGDGSQPLDLKEINAKYSREGTRRAELSTKEHNIPGTQEDESRQQLTETNSLHQSLKPGPQLYEDQSGRDESSEGIVDHNPFASAAADNYGSKAPSAAPKNKTDAAQDKQKPDARKGTATKKQIIYSDKSASSVDEQMMGDTPSNYNILNGRFDGKSAGLKSILQHAGLKGADGQAKINQDVFMKAIRGPKPNATQEERKSPRAPTQATKSNLKGVSRTNEQQERQFVSNLRSGKVNGASLIDRSADNGGWGNISQPLGQRNRVQVVGEELSADEVTSGQGKKLKKKPPQTKKK